MRFNVFILFLWATVIAAGSVAAQSPEDTVRWIYTSLSQPGSAEQKGFAYFRAPERRAQYMTNRMVTLFNANDTYGDDLASACIDFAPEIPGNDFDAAEIARTLQTTAEGDDQALSVTAQFSNFGTPAEIVYDFIPEDGFWKIDDIAGPGWRLSQIPCTAASAPSGGALTGYCYVTDNASLRLRVDNAGHGEFEFDSLGANGHFCGALGPVGPMPGGWVYQEDFQGAQCRIEITVTPESGLRLIDVDGGCKMSLCGQRAVIGERVFSRADQLDCAQIPQ
ncbi:MAG: hypothetical protein ACU0FH_05985 [Heliomarina sp.]|uniref:hypothetical protein n=1 Tax=Heliomarina sp. TaxID=2917556 RepID=UPI00405840B0